VGNDLKSFIYGLVPNNQIKRRQDSILACYSFDETLWAIIEMILAYNYIKSSTNLFLKGMV